LPPTKSGFVFDFFWSFHASQSWAKPLVMFFTEPTLMAAGAPPGPVKICLTFSVPRRSNSSSHRWLSAQCHRLCSQGNKSRAIPQF
jgi:hypothetical protein